MIWSSSSSSCSSTRCISVIAEVDVVVVEVVGVLVAAAGVVVVETRGRRQGRYGAIVLRGLCHPRHHLCH